MTTAGRWGAVVGVVVVVGEFVARIEYSQNGGLNQFLTVACISRSYLG